MPTTSAVRIGHVPEASVQPDDPGATSEGAQPSLAQAPAAAAKTPSREGGDLTTNPSRQFSFARAPSVEAESPSNLFATPPRSFAFQVAAMAATSQRKPDLIPKSFLRTPSPPEYDPPLPNAKRAKHEGLGLPPLAPLDPHGAGPSTVHTTPSFPHVQSVAASVASSPRSNPQTTSPAPLIGAKRDPSPLTASPTKRPCAARNTDDSHYLAAAGGDVAPMSPAGLPPVGLAASGSIAATAGGPVDSIHTFMVQRRTTS